MHDGQIAYVAGLIDGVGSITVTVRKNDDYRTGYRLKPEIRIQRPESDAAVLGMLDEYCDEHGVKHSMYEKNEDSIRLSVTDPESIRRFLRPIVPYLISNHEPATIMLDDVLSRVEDGTSRTEDGILELMPYVERLREESRHGSGYKYDRDYFEAEFS
jgi:hypothetical protein